VTVWYENDEFWECFRGAMFTPERWESAPEEVDHALALLGIDDGARILDLCCGPGRHTLELARRGYRVTAVDRTARFLRDLSRAAADQHLRVETVQQDMRTFRRPDAFDAAVNLFTSFGYFRDRQDDRRVAQNLFDSLQPGAPLLMEMTAKEVLARIFQPRSWEQLDDGSIALQERQLADDWSWIDNRWILIRDGERTEYHLGHRLYSAHELKSLLAGVGFHQIRACGHLSGIPYDNEAKRLVVVASKPE
jgi:SAM-dependent methyltransferase